VEGLDLAAHEGHLDAQRLQLARELGDAIPVRD
jgi:hypothetical protein